MRPLRLLACTLLFAGCTAHQHPPADEPEQTPPAPPPAPIPPPEDPPPAPPQDPPTPARLLALWLIKHPEVTALTHDPLGLVDYWTSWISTPTDALRCLHWRPDEGTARTWCWPSAAPEPPVKLTLKTKKKSDDDDTDDDDDDAADDAADDVPEPIALRERQGDPPTFRALRFPQSESAPLPAAQLSKHSKTPPIAPGRPVWYPLESQRTYLARAEPRLPAPTRGWTAFAADRPPPDEIIKSTRIRRIDTGTPDLTALEITDELEDPDDDATQVTCVRRGGRWSCTAPRVLDSLNVDDQVDLVRELPGRDGPWILLQRSTLADGGNGELSGATGEAWLEISRIDGDALTPVAALQLGEMGWVTLREGSYGSYYRATHRFFHPFAPRAPDCIAIAPTEYERGKTGPDFHTIQRIKRQQEAFTRKPVPDTLSPVDGIFELPERDDPPDDDDDLIPRNVASWVLTGLWRIDAGGDLTRLSPDPAAACPP